MATIKSHTDISQSKKLAKILPLESADMSYIGEDNALTVDYLSAKKEFDATKEVDIFPCWSLTALFNAMPQINEWITPYKHKNDKLFQFGPKICKIWEHSILPSYKVTYDKLSTDIYDNPVDACYEMVLKLHELNLL